MSGNNYYFGDNVNMEGGTGNTGIVKNTSPTPDQTLSPELRQALQELLPLLQNLRTQVPQADAALIDDYTPSLDPGTTAEPQERYRALMAIAGIAGVVGGLGEPVVAVVQRVVGLMQ